MQQIQLNIIPFTPVVSKLKFAFFGSKIPNGASIKWDKILDEFPEGREAKLKSYYSDFVTTEGADIETEIDVFKAIDFSQKYFRYQIFNYFKGIEGVVLHSNYIDDVEVWIVDGSVTHPTYKTYNKFTLKVTYKTISTGYELLIAYNGTTRIMHQSIEDLGDIDTHLFKLINCNGVVYKHDAMPDDVRQHRETLFPVIGKKLGAYLLENEQIERRENKPHNAYLPYHKNIQAFYKAYINKLDFKKLFKLHPDGFFNLFEEKVHYTRKQSNELQFLNGTHINPFLGMYEHKPYKSNTENHVKLLFIYNREDGKLIQDTIYEYIINGWHKEVNGVQKHTKNLSRFINQTLSIAKEKRIIFEDNDKIFEQVAEQLGNFVPEANTRYIAIYISPISKDDKEHPQHIAYYKLKELLLKKDISSQVLYKDHLPKEDFYNFLSNIYVALLAKMGGIPWRLQADNEDEIIIGIGAFKPQNEEERFVGSAFCFGNYGVFENFNCFREGDTEMLAGSIRNAVEIFLERKPNANRVIIHFYKEISDKKELQPILNMLGTLGKADLPVIVITVNKTESREIVGFDINDTKGKMPMSGTFVKVGSHKYLLFNSIRYTSNSVLKPKDYHFPIKLSFRSTKPELLEDDNTIQQLIDQVYQFSRMYWKSISQQNLPVTTLYPEMVARIYPYFDDDNIPEFGKSNLWFL